MDNDSDGLPNDLELKYGMNPNDPDTLKDGILDGDRIFAVTAFSEDSSPTDSVKPSLAISLKGKLIDTLKVQKISNTDIFLNSQMAGYIGNAFDFSLDGGFESATLTFEFDASLLNNPDFVPRIYYWNEEIQFLEELPNQTVSGNKVSVTITHFSSYVLLDKAERDHILMQFEIQKPTEGEPPKTRFDLVLVLDESGSISTANFNLMKEIATKLVSDFGDKDRVSVYTFSNVIRNITSFTDKGSASSAINGLTKHGGTTAIYNALGAAINEIVNNSSDDASKIIVLLTDGQNNVNGLSPEEVTQLAIDKNIIICTIGVDSVNTAVLTSIATSTGGKYYSASNFNELVEIFARLGVDLDIYKDEDDDGLSDYHEKKIALGQLKNGAGAPIGQLSDNAEPLEDYYKMDYTNGDSDNDGLFDGKDGVGVKKEIEIRSTTANIGGEVRTIYYVYMYSNPCVVDTDKDGWIDLEDPEPLKHSGEIARPVKKGLSDWKNADITVIDESCFPYYKCRDMGGDPQLAEDYHGGIDFGSYPVGTTETVFAAFGGKVLRAEWYGTYGNTIIIESVIDGEICQVYYAHLSKIDVAKGAYVKADQPIGISGNTGEGAKGNYHLHFEVRKSPYDYGVDCVVDVRHMFGTTLTTCSNPDCISYKSQA
jgi:Mg-chelatase subunit ChlD